MRTIPNVLLAASFAACLTGCFPTEHVVWSPTGNVSRCFSAKWPDASVTGLLVPRKPREDSH